jgi:hypothetical protein
MRRFTVLAISALVAAVAALSIGVAVSFAGNASIGNDTNARTWVDTYADFTIVDRNRPAPNEGWITHIDYNAAMERPMAFVVVDGGNVVKWVGDTFTPAATGVQTYTPSPPIHVQQGWNVGLYFGVEGGVIPFDYSLSAAPSIWEPNNSGKPDVGETLSIEAADLSVSGRFYSFVAEVAPTTTCAGVTAGSYAGYSQVGSTAYVPATDVDGIGGPTFTSGAAFKVESQGLYYAQSTGYAADAEWSQPQNSANWNLLTPGFSSASGDLLDLLINGTAVSWGGFQSSHLYTHDLIGTGAPATFGFGVDENNDPGWFSDNTGGLCVSVFKDSVAPNVSNVAAAPNPVVSGGSVTLTATVDDSTTGGSTITGAEYKVGAGAWTAMSASDSSFNSATENVTATFNAPATASTPSVCVRGTDAAGNTSAGTTCTTLDVNYGFHGFFQPVDNNGVFNRVKAGQAIPMKFDLSGNQGLNIFAAGSPVSVKVPCELTSPQDDVEQTVNAGGSSLSYDATPLPYGQYNYVWKTDKAWAGTCRQFQMTLNDGSKHTANFNFTK